MQNEEYDDLDEVEDSKILTSELTNMTNKIEISDLEVKRFSSQMHISNAEDEKLVGQLRNFSFCMSKQEKPITNSRDSIKRKHV